MSTRRQTTHTRHMQTMSIHMQELRLDHRKLKWQHGVSERELAICIKSMERLTWENDALKRAADEAKVQAKRAQEELRRGKAYAELEDIEVHRPASTTTTAEPTEGNKKKRVTLAEDSELDSLRTELNDEKKRRECAEREVSILQQSLRIQAEEMTGVRDDGDAKSRLLYLLAKGREEGVQLALARADAEDKLAASNRAHVSLQTQFEELRAIVEEKKRALNESEDSLLAARAEAEQTAIERDALLQSKTEAEERYEACAEQLLSRDAEVRSLAASREDLARGLEAMEVQCKTSVDAAKSESAEETRTLRARLAEEIQCRSAENAEASSVMSTLRYELESLQSRYEHERRLDADRIRQESDANEKLNASLRSHQAHQRELLNEVDNLHRDIESLQEVNLGLSSRLQSSSESGTREREKYEKMANQLSFLDAQLRRHQTQRAQLKHELQEKLTTCLEDLSVAVHERDDLRRRLAESEGVLTALRTKEHEHVKECERLRDARDRMNATLGETNRRMLEQTASTRSQYDSLVVKVRELEAGLSRERGNSERLQSLVESERRTNAALVNQIASSSASAGAALPASIDALPSTSRAIKASPLDRDALRRQREQLSLLDTTATPATTTTVIEAINPPETSQVAEERHSPNKEKPLSPSKLPTAAEVIAEADAILGDACDAPEPRGRFHRIAVPMSDVINTSTTNAADGKINATEAEEIEEDATLQHHDIDIVDYVADYEDDVSSDVSMTLSQLAASDAHLGVLGDDNV